MGGCHAPACGQTRVALGKSQSSDHHSCEGGGSLDLVVPMGSCAPGKGQREGGGISQPKAPGFSRDAFRFPERLLTCLYPWAPVPAGSGDFLDSWRKRVTRPRPGQLPFRSPREWAGAGPEGRGTFWKVGTGRRFSAERARSNLGEGQRARRKRQASEQSPTEKEQEMWGATQWPHPPPSSCLSTRLTCVCRGERGSFFLKHFGIKVPEVSWGGETRTG